MTQQITFINPPNFPFSSTGILIEPIDTLGLASFTQNLGYSVRFLDMDVKKMLAQDLKEYFGQHWSPVVVIVFDYHIPLHDAGANAEIKRICDLAHEHGCTVILGGKAATFYDEKKLKTLGADIFIKHDMEKPLENILDAYFYQQQSYEQILNTINNIRYWRDEKLVENSTYQLENKLSDQEPQKKSKRFEINDLPIPDRNLIDLNDYIDVRTILSSRGCNLQCTFCHVPGFWGNWQGRNPSSVVDEIEMLVRNHGSKKILFLDDNAMAQPRRMMAISQELIARKIEVALGCLGTIISYNKDIMTSMYAAGFRWIHYGAESADNIQLHKMGKKTNSEQILDVVKATQNLGFRVRTSWILDMPDLTIEGLEKTEKMILNHGANEIRLHFLTLRLGSILFNELQLDTPQFIHNSQQNLNLSGVDEKDIQLSVNRIIYGLKEQGYVIVKNPEDFKHVENLRKISPELKVVSLCPLRYGLGWQY